MTTVQVPVKVLDEKCISCNCLSIGKQDLYYGADESVVQYYCDNLHMCTYIRNRIVRNEQNKEERADSSNERTDNTEK